MFNKTDSKVSTKTFFYRDYKKFEDNKFARDLTHELKNMKTLSYTQFEKAHVLDNHVPLNKKELRFNYGPFMTKALRKTLMTWSRLKNMRETPSQNKTGLLQGDIKSVSDTKKFWKTIKLYFSNKGSNSNKIFLSYKRSCCNSCNYE